MESNKEQYQSLIYRKDRLEWPAMTQQNNMEGEAIMNLLYIGDDEEHWLFDRTFKRREFGVLNDHHNKVKSNTIHLRTNKKNYPSTHHKIGSLQHSLEGRKKSSENKENLKRILQKLENSPPPPPKRKPPAEDHELERIQTQIFDQPSKSISKYGQHKSLEFTKKSLSKFFDKKKDKDLIKRLIKDKIVEKLKKVDVKKSEKKVYNLGLRTDTLTFKSTRTSKQERRSVLKTEKSKSRSNFLNLLWEERKINNPVMTRKSSKLGLKQLLF